jgi:hypothetical protein
VPRDRRRSFSTNTGFRDLLFNLVVGFVFLFVIAFILINPPVKKSDAPKKAEFLIVLEWETESIDDVDLWVKDPQGITVAFVNKEGGYMNLEKDDLGLTNDCYVNGQGERVCLQINREVITVRGIQPGRFQVATHIYSRPPRINKKEQTFVSDTGPIKMRVTLIKINPYSEVYRVEKSFTEKGQVFTMFNFQVDAEGNVIDVDEYENNIVYRRSG